MTATGRTSDGIDGRRGVSAGTDLSGRRALVTGASGGLGLHFAQVLAAAGADVTLAARRFDKVEAAAKAIRDGGGSAQGVALDVTDAASIEAAMAEPFDILVNNAGISGTGAAMDLPLDAFEDVIRTNLTGAFAVARAAARGMADDGGGSIVNIASILGHRVAGHVAAYAAAKAALVQLTKALALEWARHGVRVNALSPGYVETPINAEFFATEAGQALVRRIPQRRLGRMSDLDGPLLLLASDAGAYMTGHSLVVDGGHLCSSL
ncbi:SDR family oxidoreductase [Rhodobacterales bacterium HKCCE2091]|nr:SDR family oxidoreductase [Rhodobacterales bacterium HKCCE2091]